MKKILLIFLIGTLSITANESVRFGEEGLASYNKVIDGDVFYFYRKVNVEKINDDKAMREITESLRAKLCKDALISAKIKKGVAYNYVYLGKKEILVTKINSCDGNISLGGEKALSK